MQRFKRMIFPIASAALIFILSAAEIYNMRPFGTGAYLALLTASAPIYVIAPVYLLSQALFVPVASELWGYVAVTAVGVVAKLVFLRLKKQMPLYAAAAVGVLGACGFIYAGVTGTLSALNIILSTLFSLLFMLVCYLFLRPVSAPDSYAAATEPELLAGCVILCAAFIALAREISSFTFGYLFAAFITLYALAVSGVGAAMVCALSMGCGMSLTSLEPYPIAVLAFAAALAAVFKDGHRLLCVAGYFLGFCMALFLFTSRGLSDVLSALIGCAVFAVIPRKVFAATALMRSGDAKKAALIAAYNRERRKTGAELMTAADIFSRMSTLMGGAGSEAERSAAYAKKLLEQVCEACPHREDCRARSFEVMQRLVSTSLEKDCATVGGMPEEILSDCRSIGTLVGKLNVFVERNKEERSKEQALGSAARLVNAQLSGAEGIMRRFATRLNSDAVFDTDGERKIAEELTYGGCNCIGATVAETDDGKEVSVIVRERDFDRDKAAGVLRHIYKRPFFFVSSDEGYAPQGYSSVRFRSGAPLDVVFGVSQVGKDGSGVIGDKYSFTRLNAGGFMMAISAGMGTGKKASDVSDTAVSLVENYYRAGFDTGFVLSSVNRFLSLSKDETFSAMDIAVLNLNTLVCDIIKIGSPPTRIRRGGRVASIGGGSLPLGALEDITPYCESVKAEEGDMIVMVSDGVEDAFKEGELEALLSRETTLNPQTLSAKILSQALNAYGGVQRDDMTVLCGRVYARI